MPPLGTFTPTEILLKPHNWWRSFTSCLKVQSTTSTRQQPPQYISTWSLLTTPSFTTTKKKKSLEFILKVNARRRTATSPASKCATFTKIPRRSIRTWPTRFVWRRRSPRALQVTTSGSTSSTNSLESLSLVNIISSLESFYRLLLTHALRRMFSWLSWGTSLVLSSMTTASPWDLWRSWGSCRSALTRPRRGNPILRWP